MTSRTAVSYDDITLPYENTTPKGTTSSSKPPAKKRKKSNNKSSQNAGNKAFARNQVYQEDDDEGEYVDGHDEEENRELTHEEIWDDSALVDAWEAAMEEYNAFHGTDDDWKKEPVKKSPLWYNVPIESSKNTSNPTSPMDVTVDISAVEVNSDGEDSKPINFDTFVPTHDASLNIPATSAPAPDLGYIPTSDESGVTVSQDEAFSRALSAMYWTGYWTAMYYTQRQKPQPEIHTDVYEKDGEEHEQDDNDDIELDKDEFSSTQR